ncbi:MAG: hypothetical protein JW928_03210 [Candidatus Aureabacteria bacterium]|nr:hypothetical protein [Candidatus Auribacterota bacterium]
MKKILFFLCVFFIFLSFSRLSSAADFLGVGRGEGLTSVLLTMEKDTEKSRFLIGERTEVFCVDSLGDDRFIVGGVTKNKGTVWIVQKDKILHMEHLPEANVIYGIKKASDGTVWAAGSHKYMGACVWKGTDKGEFQDPTVLSKGSVAYAVCEGLNGEIFVGGIFFTHGKVWMHKDGQWNLGDMLTDSKQINSLCVDREGVVYACGQKIRYGEAASGHGTVHQGGVWTFNGQQWGPAIEIPQSIDIYCSAVDSDGKVWLGGAGDMDKTVWVLEMPLWKPITIENCLALYSMTVDRKTGNMTTAGWNKQIRGRIWFKEKDKEWNPGQDIDKCSVIRGLTALSQ